MRPRRGAYLLIFFLALSCQAGYCGDIWVSPAGNDHSCGDRSAPLQTLHQALRLAREWRRLADPRISGGIHIYLTGGTYYLSEPLFIRPEDSGSETSPTIIEGDDSETAVLSGGLRVTGWQKAGRYWKAFVPKSGGRPITVRQLWSNGRKCPQSCQFEGTKMERMLQFDKSSRTITIPTPSQLLQEGDFSQMELMVHQRWAIAYLRVKDYTVEGDCTVLRFHEPESRIEFEHPWPQPVIGGSFGSSSFRLLNALPFLDHPGEWYHDYSSGTLYYMAPEGEDPNNMEMVVPMTSTLVEITGNRNDRVSNIIFRHVGFEYAAWNRPSTHGHVTLQGGFPIIDAYKLQQEGLPWAPHLENQAWITRPEHAFGITYAHHIKIDGCRFRHLASTGLDCVTGVSDLTINGNEFTDIGGNAILCGSFGDGVSEVHRPYPLAKDDTSYTQRISITHNRITDATNEDWGCVGIGCGYVRDVEIAQNLVDKVNYSGISVGWGWTSHDTGMRNNHIYGNTVRNFALQLYDAGGIYTLSAQPGSTITDNVIDLRGEAPYATNDRGFYIYLDEATDGYTIDGNWCPEAYFGDNKPGPSVVWKENGPNVKLMKNR